MKTRQIDIIIGTRAEATKLAPVAHELRRRKDIFQTRIIATGQHRDLLEDMISVLRIEPDVSLGVMRDGQTLSSLAARLLGVLEEEYKGSRPDTVVVQGDTTSTFIGALAAFHEGIPVAHVEAGLRSGDLSKPFPEEGNRRLVSQIAALHFPPTNRARQNLLDEGVSPEKVHVTGNTAVDALQSVREFVKSNPGAVSAELQSLRNTRRRIVTMTCHRRESFGEPIKRIFAAIRRLADEFDDIEILYPVHPNPNVVAAAREHLSGHDRIRLIQPLDYVSFVWLMERSCLLLSDSGGVQEEAPSLGVPVLILRDVTERPECVEAGAARLVGTDGEALYIEARRLLSDETARKSMCVEVNPFGDGHAAKRIADIMAQ